MKPMATKGAKRKAASKARAQFSSDPKECQFEQDLDYSQTRRQLSYRRKKEEMKKKLARLEKLQKIIQEKEAVAAKQGGEGGEDGVSSASAAAKTPFFAFARGASIGGIGVGPRLHDVQRSRYGTNNLCGDGGEDGGGSDDEPERMSTASVMELRIQEVKTELAQLELEMMAGGPVGNAVVGIARGVLIRC